MDNDDHVQSFCLLQTEPASHTVLPLYPIPYRTKSVNLLKRSRYSIKEPTPHCPQTDTERAGALSAKATPRDAKKAFISNDGLEATDSPSALSRPLCTLSPLQKHHMSISAG